MCNGQLLEGLVYPASIVHHCAIWLGEKSGDKKSLCKMSQGILISPALRDSFALFKVSVVHHDFILTERSLKVSKAWRSSSLRIFPSLQILFQNFFTSFDETDFTLIGVFPKIIRNFWIIFKHVVVLEESNKLSIHSYASSFKYIAFA